MPDVSVMISYSRKDWALVEPVVQVLRNREVPVWLDRKEIPSGTEWRKVLLRTPQQVHAFVPFLSNNYVDSEMCRMELFLARASERPIFPVMLEECWARLREREETKNISMLFAARLQALSSVSLPLTRNEVIERLVTAIMETIHPKRKELNNAYISYPDRSGPFATKLRHELVSELIRPWVATLDCMIGDDWRRAQVQAMSRSRAHIVVISTEFLRNIDVLRTELIMSESLEIPTFGAMSDELSSNEIERGEVYAHLDKGEDAFRRLTKRQWYPSNEVTTTLLRDVSRAIQGSITASA